MTTLNSTEVKKIAKELKIKNWWNKKRAELVAEIAELKGWSHEKPEVIEFLLSGGEIKQCPTQDFPAPKVTKETQAMATRKKPRKRPTKTTESTEKKFKRSKESTEGMVTLAQICEEMGVEGRIARRKLRGSEIKKPGTTWAWPEGDEGIDEVKDLLK